MTSKDVTVFETTYEKVLTIIDKVKNFIKSNTKNYESIIDELDWIKNVIITKTLCSYEVNKEKLAKENNSPSNQKFLDFITQYNEEILNLDRKHTLVRNILGLKNYREFLQKPSLILKKIKPNEATKSAFNEMKNKSGNKAINPLGNWILSIYYKMQEQKNNSKKNYVSTDNIHNYRYNKISVKKGNKNANIKNMIDHKYKKMNIQVINVSSSFNYLHHYSNIKTVEANTNSKTKYSGHKSKNEKNNYQKRMNLSFIKRAMEKYLINEMELKRKNKVQKSVIIKNNNIINNKINNNKKEKPNNIAILREKHFEFMKTIYDEDFNIFKLKKLVGYKNVLPLMCHFMFKILGLIDSKIICVKKLSSFLTTVSQGYLESTLYHNSLHGADVCHSLFLYITTTNIEEICESSVLDILGLVVSASGHDLGHPGYNNNFHINAKTELALTYNDISCLENMHTSTLFKILNKDENNIFENMDVNDYKRIRKRMVSQILSTDMVNHAMVLSFVKAKVSEWQQEKKINENKKFIYLSGNEKTKFDEQQNMYNYLIHTADLGHNASKYEISKQWIDLLLQEFFIQGDAERKKKLPISFLCDRYNIDIPQSQIGFLRGFILGTFDILVAMFPNLKYTLDNTNNNIKEWQKKSEEKKKNEKKENKN